MSSEHCRSCADGKDLWGSHIEQCKDCGRVRDELYPKTGKACSVCRAPQYRVPAGDICQNGHGGAPGIPLYPELAKMKSVQAETRTLSQFVDWLEENNMRICVRTKGSGAYAPPYESTSERYEQLFARFFEIDLDKVEQERQQMLEEQRKLNERGRK